MIEMSLSLSLGSWRWTRIRRKARDASIQGSFWKYVVQIIWFYWGFFDVEADDVRFLRVLEDQTENRESLDLLVYL